jgi:hypothetical protein
VCGSETRSLCGTGAFCAVEERVPCVVREQFLCGSGKRYVRGIGAVSLW